MAFYQGNIRILDNIYGANVPAFTSSTRPGTPVNGQIIYNSSTNLMEIYDSGIWKDVDTSGSGNSYFYRQIITTSYVMGGYQNTSPWKNVNRMATATDVMTNLGDLLAAAQAYTSGACSLSKGFLWASDNAWPGTSTQTAAFNLATETGAGLNSAWNMTVAKNDCATVWKETEYAWVTGGGDTTIQQMNLTTDIMSNSAVRSTLAGAADYQYGLSSLNDETAGYWYDTSGNKFTFATLTVSASNVASSNGQQKGISTKLGYGYNGNEGTYNGGYNFRKWVFSTTTYTTCVRPIGNIGEENYDQGQGWQYMMGMYDGAQNNRGWKFNYSTDSGYELGAGSVRTGVPGGSSGHCVWKG